MCHMDLTPILVTGVLTIVSGAIGALLAHGLAASRDTAEEGRRIAAEGRAAARQDELLGKNECVRGSSGSWTTFEQ